MDNTISPIRHSHKKVCGYLGCFIIVAALFSEEVPQLNANSQKLEATSIASTKSLQKPRDKVYNSLKISLNTETPNRVYFINDQPVTVDTTKEGWIVELMYAQKKKDEKILKP